MLSKNILKLIKSLQIKKFRDEHGLFIVEGKKSVLEVLASDFQIQWLLVTSDYEKEFHKFKDKVSNFEIINQNDLEDISRINSNDTALAVVCQKKQSNFTETSENKIIILDHIQDPGNMGTIIRTADWFGFNQIICSKDCVELYNPKVITSTMGSFTRVSVFYENLDEVMATLKKAKFTIYGALLEGKNLQEVKIDQKIALVIGNESNGISDNMLKNIDQSVTIAKYGKAESLNAGIAAGILMHHFVGFENKQIF
jgi:TrmH family RNA methyltransferase